MRPSLWSKTEDLLPSILELHTFLKRLTKTLPINHACICNKNLFSVTMISQADFICIIWKSKADFIRTKTQYYALSRTLVSQCVVDSPNFAVPNQRHITHWSPSSSMFRSLPAWIEVNYINFDIDLLLLDTAPCWILCAFEYVNSFWNFLEKW